MIHDPRARMLVMFLALAAGPGCTSSQLRRHTINQATTVHDIYQQQVLDNLAMFVHNRGSYPYFSLIGQGTSSLTDTATLADTNSWGRNAAGSFIYTATGLNPSAMRQQQGTWQTYPISDSIKLSVMRCVYHAAMDGCAGAAEQSCPDCASLFYAYYNMIPPYRSNSIPYHSGPNGDPLDPSNLSYVLGNLTGDAKAKTNVVTTDIPFGTPDQFKGYTFELHPNENSIVEESYAATSPANMTVLRLSEDLKGDHGQKERFRLTLRKRLPIRGVVTPECLSFPQTWFCHGSKLPKHFDRCLPHGYYCGTYVWVPEGGIDHLTKLILLIQDIAYYEPPHAEGETVTTQKTQGQPGPNTGSSPSTAMLKALSDNIMKMESLNNDKKLDMHRVMLNALPDVEPAVATTTTTTTTSTPSIRQPTQFQSGILNLQQDLNLLPPQPR